MSDETHADMLTLTQLRKSFDGARHAQAAPLLQVDRLELAAGGHYALTGRNGVGKTTLLRILAGLDNAQAGEIHWAGQRVDVRRLPGAYPTRWRRDIVYVHQHPYMFDASVTDNASYALRAHGLWDEAGQERLRALLAWAGLEPLADRTAPGLSGGEKQRLALVRALAVQPQFLLLDEPTSNLDGEAREAILKLIDDLAGQGRTLVVVTHDRDLLGAWPFERLKLADGKLEPR